MFGGNFPSFSLSRSVAQEKKLDAQLEQKQILANSVAVVVVVVVWATRRLTLFP